MTGEEHDRIGRGPMNECLLQYNLLCSGRIPVHSRAPVLMASYTAIGAVPVLVAVMIRSWLAQVGFEKSRGVMADQLMPQVKYLILVRLCS